MRTKAGDSHPHPKNDERSVAHGKEHSQNSIFSASDRPAQVISGDATAFIRPLSPPNINSGQEPSLENPSTTRKTAQKSSSSEATKRSPFSDSSHAQQQNQAKSHTSLPPSSPKNSYIARSKTSSAKVFRHCCCWPMPPPTGRTTSNYSPTQVLLF